jgi:hypothetical protein
MTATEELIADMKLWSCSPRVPLKAQLVMLEAIGRLSSPPEATPWMPTAEQPNFDQRALKAEIAKIWGEHGAHAEVYRMLLRDAARYWWLRNANSIMPGAPGKRPIEWYCGTDADEAIDKAIASSSGPQETRS